MPIDLGSSFAALDRGLELLPRVIVAPLLLGGPTLLWLLYRFLVRPGSVSTPHEPLDLPVWVCGSCASVTPVGQTACYRCRAERPAAIQLVSEDKVPEAAPTATRAASRASDAYAGVPVGPGRPAPPPPTLPRPTPDPIALATVPPVPTGPVISPPSRIRVSGRRTTNGTIGTKPAAPEAAGTSRRTTTKARRRSGQG